MLSYPKWFVLALAGEVDVLYVSRMDDNDHHPHDANFWWAIPKYKPDEVYSEGSMVFLTTVSDVIFMRCGYDGAVDNLNLWYKSRSFKHILHGNSSMTHSSHKYNLERKFNTGDVVVVTKSHSHDDKIPIGSVEIIDSLGKSGASVKFVTKVTSNIQPPPTYVEYSKLEHRYTYQNNINISPAQKGIEEDDVRFLLTQLEKTLTEADMSLQGPQGVRYEQSLIKHNKFLKIKDLYKKAIEVETHKRGHSESSRIEKRWGNELLIIEEAIRNNHKLPDNFEKALDKVYDELLGYVESAGEYYESVDSFICLDTMVDVILHPAK